ncbi:hypothetical protein CcBV_15.4 [Bracoviriform congregatae]|uniref:Uncharacterized protein n=1 Tax=Bracoviriform congregatae TaxID=39640 RepID=Q5ZP04_9VIRU|nr:hypothetical protein CcBV_15.4 [Bracoviriform congregatae]CAG17453.1 hypothetical protein CcBV_15.4 [Bracoviriform congregatae]
MIMKPDPVTYFLQVQNIPAKLVRNSTRTGFINVFQKVSHKELADAFRCDTALPKDLYSVKINFASGNQSCNELR